MYKVVGASIGDCVHIQGIYNFLELAKSKKYHTIFLGPAIKISKLLKFIKSNSPEIVAISYRLTPDNLSPLLDVLEKEIKESNLSQTKFIFGGTPPNVSIARDKDFFDFIFDGNNFTELESFLSGIEDEKPLIQRYPQNIINRIKTYSPYPLLRAHYGEPTFKRTLKGIVEISNSAQLDVISLGIDQQTQQLFFNPESFKKDRMGAGGVPITDKSGFEKLYQASRCGNHPILRCYAGTDNLERFAKMLIKTINNGWSAIPIFWFNKMDGRGPHDLITSLNEHLNLISYHAEVKLPVEILESHHWGMRWAHDTIVVTSAILGALICKRLGVENYIHQYMFNVPPQTSHKNDLAKMLCVKELLEEISDDTFNVFHQTRAGLPSFPNDLDLAKGQLASSTALQMQINPNIIHVVSFSEPNHAANYEDVIQSAKIVHQVIKNNLDAPKQTFDKDVIYRKEELKAESKFLIDFINKNGDIIDPIYLHSLAKSGILDAPMLKNNKYVPGKSETLLFEGGFYPSLGGKKISEFERIAKICDKSTFSLDI